MPLNPFEILQGILTLIFVLISILLGLSIISKYRLQRNRLFILVGITWICVISPYWPDAISIISILFFNASLGEPLYFFLAMAFIPLVHVTWILAITDMMFKSKQKPIMAFIIVEAFLYEIVFLYFLFTDPSLIGTQVAPFDVDWTYFIIIYLFLSIIAFTITGLLFARESLRSENEEIRLKGKFLLIAFISFAVGAFFESAMVLNEITLVIIRIIVLTAAFEFYIGFTLPSIVKKAFIKS
ncbi:MAG: hypothetical protein EU539_11645 [Promethearchaeota archaeon]|nr:MAG: hypothetical protein EU539_11645 [Candidatus Lokiarchaeota archaeon]